VAVVSRMLPSEHVATSLSVQLDALQKGSRALYGVPPRSFQLAAPAAALRLLPTSLFASCLAYRPCLRLATLLALGDEPPLLSKSLKGAALGYVLAEPLQQLFL
jgi:hypothetical protein